MWSEAVTLHSDAGKKLPMMPACGVWGQTEHLGRLAVPEKQARVPLIMTSAVSARWKTPGRIFEGQKNITSKKNNKKWGLKKKEKKKKESKPCPSTQWWKCSLSGAFSFRAVNSTSIENFLQNLAYLYLGYLIFYFFFGSGFIQLWETPVSVV